MVYNIVKLYGTITITAEGESISIPSMGYDIIPNSIEFDVSDDPIQIHGIDDGDLEVKLLSAVNTHRMLVEDNTVSSSELYGKVTESRVELRDALFSTLTVEVNGKWYDADEPARTRVADHITILSGQVDETFTLTWTLANNEKATLTLDELREVGVAIAVEQNKLWGLSKDELIDLSIEKGLLHIPGYIGPDADLPDVGGDIGDSSGGPES